MIYADSFKWERCDERCWGPKVCSVHDTLLSLYGEFRAPFKQIQTTQSTELVGQVRVLFISFDFLMMRLRFHSCCGWCELSFYVVICGDVIWNSPNDGLSGTRWVKFNRGWPGALTYILLCPISFHSSLISFWAFIFCSSLEDDWGRLNWSSHQDARNLNMLDCVRRCLKRMSSALLTRSLSFTGTKARKDTKTLNEELQVALEENCTSLSAIPVCTWCLRWAANPFHLAPKSQTNCVYIGKLNRKMHSGQPRPTKYS